MHSEYATTPGSELVRRRKALGAKQQEVAAILGLGRTAVWRMEKNPQVPVLEARKYLDALAQIARREEVAS